MARTRPAPAPPRQRARRLPPEERRAQLLDRAADLLLEEGPDALTMERLADRTGVSKGLGYAYFRDAEDVALALWDREVTEVYERVEAASAEAPGLEEGLRRAVAAYFDIVAERGALLGALQARFGARPERRVRRRLRAFLGFWSDRVQGAGDVEPATALTLAAMMLSAADAAVRIWGAGAIGRARAEELCMDFLISGLRGAGAMPARSRQRRRAR